MQDELNKAISQALDTNTEFNTELPAPKTEGELSDEALEEVAGGVCVGWSFIKACVAWSFARNANKSV
ncbi:hypothetical protein AB0758_10190 [Tolypothrix bouteillei VB521301_2]|uniref:Bacteriocin n=1 Tax=Tolypothrix bouteillei VB521301 TaxID=1479485 RepID=A0A8S9T297_9CYAN|nr:hypothetical protein [Tolypothrix bouteillei]KAF3886226.1 hypothetical protein DA73_0400012625 [Tolypothrix bouteillei VB521301]